MNVVVFLRLDSIREIHYIVGNDMVPKEPHQKTVLHAVRMFFFHREVQRQLFNLVLLIAELLIMRSLLNAEREKEKPTRHL